MNAPQEVTVSAVGGFDYLVRVGTVTEHRVRAAPEVLKRVAREDEAPEDTIARAFRFLLEREGPESILRRFALEEIGRYFPEFWSVMSGRT